ncbi:cupin-like domain-containing protein [Agriterribacter humi]|uniref:cupin-like domain-containing protein n=1 Tax=Agriterribacter humi TaxID=1104781 RepID=UPI001D019496|nr:cupin-like domain-containing protein [Agriterribacter humi]
MYGRIIFAGTKLAYMLLQPVEAVDTITPEGFKNQYYDPGKPVVIKSMSKDWPAYHKWTWDYFKEMVGDKRVGIFNNNKSDAFTPVNKADEYTSFGEYIDMIRKGPAGWRIFLFNIFDHAPQLTHDFEWPDDFMKGFIKRFPMLFVGGATSVTHLHFDIDLSHILHTQFVGRKRVLLFPYEEQHKLYRKPFEVLSLADFSRYYEHNGTPDYDRFPALKLAKGYEVTLQHGDTLYMPAGYWHHMEYIDSGFAMSLRALHQGIGGKVKGAWNLIGMRNIDTLMKKTVPKWWDQLKNEKTMIAAQKVLEETEA